MSRCAKAFTLIETIAVMVILGTLSAVFSTVLFSATDGYADTARSRQSTEGVAIAIERMTASLRAAAPPDDSTPLIVGASRERIEFSSGLILEFSDGALLMTRPGEPEAVLLADCVGRFRIFADGPADEQELDFDDAELFGGIRVIGIAIESDNRTIATRVLLRNALGTG